jgi:hypothetical protein
MSEPVEQYFKSHLSRGTSPDVKQRLERVDWKLLGVPNPTPLQVHRIRKLIEQNLADGPS